MNVNVRQLYHVPRSQVWEGSGGRQQGHVHLHVQEDVVLGRIKRRANECLCPKRHGSYERPLDPGEHDTKIRCPKCEEIANRFQIPWPGSETLFFTPGLPPGFCAIDGKIIPNEVRSYVVTTDEGRRVTACEPCLREKAPETFLKVGGATE